MHFHRWKWVLLTGPISFHSGFDKLVLITQHISNKLLLEAILKQFNVGYIVQLDLKN